MAVCILMYEVIWLETNSRNKKRHSEGGQKKKKKSRVPRSTGKSNTGMAHLWVVFVATEVVLSLLDVWVGSRVHCGSSRDPAGGQQLIKHKKRKTSKQRLQIVIYIFLL